MAAAIDLTGQRFGRLLVIERVENDAKGRTVWACQCDCKATKKASSYSLRSGVTQSCGCLQSENGRQAAKRLTKHGVFAAHKDKYQMWRNMIRRCHNSSDKQYPDYGAKGVYVCDEWRTFPGFIEWAHNRPQGMTLDRIDPAGPYRPENCRWVGHDVQQNNRRRHVWVQYKGERHTATQLARKLGVTPWKIYNGIKDFDDPFHYVKSLL